MLADDFMSLSTKIFDILGDEIDFHLNDTTIPFEDGGYFLHLVISTMLISQFRFLMEVIIHHQHILNFSSTDTKSVY